MMWSMLTDSEGVCIYILMYLYKLKSSYHDNSCMHFLSVALVPAADAYICSLSKSLHIGKQVRILINVGTSRECCELQCSLVITSLNMTSSCAIHIKNTKRFMY